MPPPRRPAGPHRTPSDPAWAEVQELVIQLRSLAPDDPQQAEPYQRLYRQLQQRLLGVTVQMLGDDSADARDPDADPADNTRLRANNMLMAIVRQQLRHLGDGQRAALEAEHGRITHIAHDAVGEMVARRLRNRQSLLMGWRLGEGANIETYVSRVALNLLRDMADRAGRHHRGRVLLSDTGEGGEAGDAQALPAQMPGQDEAGTGDEAQEQMRFIAAAVQRMDGVAALVMQELYQGLTETAAAAKSGLSRSTYQRRKAEVVARLRGLWAGDSGPAGD